MTRRLLCPFRASDKKRNLARQKAEAQRRLYGHGSTKKLSSASSEWEKQRHTLERRREELVRLRFVNASDLSAALEATRGYEVRRFVVGRCPAVMMLPGSKHHTDGKHVSFPEFCGSRPPETRQAFSGPKRLILPPPPTPGWSFSRVFVMHNAPGGTHPV